MSKIKKVALVLSGGGFKGAFQLGVLNYLHAHWEAFFPEVPHMQFDIIAGISAGSLNGVMVAADQLRELNYIWKKIGRNGAEEIYHNNFLTENKESEDKLTLNIQAIRERFFPHFNSKLNYLSGARLMLSKRKRQQFLAELSLELYNEFRENFNNIQGLVTNFPLARKLKEHIDRKNLKTDFLCGFVSLDTGKYISAHQSEFDSNDDFIRGVLASTSIPIIFPPIPSLHLNGKEYKNLIDGGLVNVSPIVDVINFIHKKGGNPEDYALLIVNLGTTQVEQLAYDKADIIRIALRATNEISSAHNFNKDLETLLRVNDLVKQISSTKKPIIYKYDIANNKRTKKEMNFFKNIVIQPDVGRLGGSLQVNSSLNDQRYAHGKLKSEQALQELLDKRDSEYLSIIV